MVDTTGNVRRAIDCARDVQWIFNCEVDAAMVAHGIEAARRHNAKQTATK